MSVVCRCYFRPKICRQGVKPGTLKLHGGNALSVDSKAFWNRNSTYHLKKSRNQSKKKNVSKLPDHCQTTFCVSAPQHNPSKRIPQPSDLQSQDDKLAKLSDKNRGDEFLKSLGYVTNHNEFLSFEKAREYVREIHLSSQTEWSKWRSSPQRPYNIPSDPHITYAGKGWVSYPDWLGYGVGRVAFSSSRGMSFCEAREYMLGVGLGSCREWFQWCREGRRPSSIPSRPDVVYKNSGWVSWPHFLGNDFLPFEEAREFIRALDLKSVREWHAWRSSPERPSNIPANPHVIYANWLSYPDWLGVSPNRCKAQRRGTFLPLADARELVRCAGLRSLADWKAWCRQGSRPPGVPSCPDVIYKDSGWVSWPHFLGYSAHRRYNRRGRKSQHLPFHSARQHVHSLGLGSLREWAEWSSGPDRPRGQIPAAPHHVYANQGWVSYPDWLGYGVDRKKHFSLESGKSFDDAREFMRSQNLKSHSDWVKWCRLGLRPPDVPSNPQLVYKTTGWVSWPDFLGYQARSDFLPFCEARELVQELKLRSKLEWNEWSSGPDRPKNIPSNPNVIYAGKGWKSFPEWMGYDRQTNSDQVQD